jgi:GNAT superfamily N-acetyltransferase
LKPGVRIREAAQADANAIARVHVDTWRTAYRGLIAAAFLESLTYEAREKRWAAILGDPAYGKKTFSFVAEDAGAIVGFASGGPEREADPVHAGEIYAAYVLEAYHRRGVGRLLLASVGERFVRDGVSAVMVWVLAGNPACRFYEARGGVRLRTKMAEIGGASYEEIAYGWSDASRLTR